MHLGDRDAGEDPVPVVSFYQGTSIQRERLFSWCLCKALERVVCVPGNVPIQRQWGSGRGPIGWLNTTSNTPLGRMSLT